jgi:hypothetical protein
MQSLSFRFFLLFNYGLLIDIITQLKYFFMLIICGLMLIVLKIFSEAPCSYGWVIDGVIVFRRISGIKKDNFKTSSCSIISDFSHFIEVRQLIVGIIWFLD